MTRRLRLHRGKIGDTGYKGIEVARAPEVHVDPSSGPDMAAMSTVQRNRLANTIIVSTPEGLDSELVSRAYERERNRLNNAPFQVRPFRTGGVIEEVSGLTQEMVDDAIRSATIEFSDREIDRALNGTSPISDPVGLLPGERIIRQSNREISATRQFPDEITYFAEQRRHLPRYDVPSHFLPEPRLPTPRSTTVEVVRSLPNGDTLTLSCNITLEGKPLSEDQTARARAYMEQKIDEDLLRGVVPRGVWNESIPIEVLQPPPTPREVHGIVPTVGAALSERYAAMRRWLGLKP